KFDSLINTNIRAYGSVFGVVDHNDAVMFTAGSQFFNTNNLTWPRDGVTCTGGWGDGSWAYPLTPGGVGAPYLENNTVTSSNLNFQGGIVDSNNGARTVIRYNTMINAGGIGSHGADSGQRYRGSRWIETYENSFTFDPSLGANTIAWYRGGSG